MLEHVLIAYDGSAASKRALEAGARLAHAVGARVTLFHNLIEGPIPADFEGFVSGSNLHGGWADSYVSFAAGHSGGYYDAGPMLPDELQAVANGLLREAGERLSTFGITAYDSETGSGDPAYNILEYARKNDVDTIVAGTRGHGRLAEMVIGSVSHKLQHGFGGSTLVVH